MIACVNGQFVEASGAQVSLFDRGFFYGDGIYETLRTYKGNVWQLDAHLDRLMHSAALVGMELVSYRAQIAQNVEETVRRNGFPESRVRVTVSRGVTNPEKPELTVQQSFTPTIAITVTPFHPVDPSLYKNGVSVITFPIERFLPEAKTLFFLPQFLARTAALKASALEALLQTRDGFLTEGTISNFFLVQGQTVITPGSQILFGVTRATVLAVVAKHFTVVERSVTLKDCLDSTECFLTNTSWEVMPVVTIDGKKIGNGRPGSVTQQIWKDFRAVISGLRIF